VVEVNYININAIRTEYVLKHLKELKPNFNKLKLMNVRTCFLKMQAIIFRKLLNFKKGLL